MKKFVLFFSVFVLVSLATFYAIFRMAGGKADAFYMRFVSGKKSSLIIGTSRSAQGILPAELDKKLSRKDFFNYSFSINISPYGRTYLESIKKKLVDGGDSGIFILAIDPWSLCDSMGDASGTIKFREDDAMLGKINPNGGKPNISYLLNCYDNHYWEIIKSNSNTFLHKDGWLEVTVPMDENSITRRRKSKIKEYTDNLPYNQFSQTRYDYLIQTINFLKGRGSVYLVRLPIHPSIMEIENGLMPGFNDKVAGILDATHIPYLDMSYLNSKYTYTDGSHLYKKCGLEVTDSIAQWISQKGMR